MRRSLLRCGAKVDMDIICFRQNMFQYGEVTLDIVCVRGKSTESTVTFDIICLERNICPCTRVVNGDHVHKVRESQHVPVLRDCVRF